MERQAETAWCEVLRRHWGGKEITVCPLRRVGNSACYRVWTDAGSYFVKRGPRVRAEYENLMGLRPPADPRFGLPRIELFVPEQNVLVFDFEPGRSLLLELLALGFAGARTWGRRKLERDVALVAEWLASFHQANLVGIRDVREEEIALADGRLAQIRRFLNARERQQAAEAVRRGPWKATPICRSSRDFAPRNVLIRADSVVVVDWECVLTKPIYYNLAYFVANVEARARWPLYSSEFQENLGRVFLEAYAAAARTVDAEAYAFYRYVYDLEYLCDYETLTGVFEPWRGPTRTMDAFIRARVRPRILRFLGR